MTSIYNKFYAIKKCIYKSLRLNRSSNLPHNVNMRSFVKKGCIFEVSTPIEVFRIELFGSEKDFMDLILNEVKKEDTIYDIGACVGLVAINAACKGANVVAFEPDPSYRARLGTNIKLNKLNNIQIIEWAVSDTKGLATFFTDGVEGISPSLRENGLRGSIQVQTDTVDNALQRKEIPLPDIIKLDIEGAEILALRGMEELLKSDRAPRKLFIEIHPDFLPSFGSTMQDVIELLENFNYYAIYKCKRLGQLHYIFNKRS